MMENRKGERRKRRKCDPNVNEATTTAKNVSQEKRKKGDESKWANSAAVDTWTHCRQDES